MKHRDVTKLVDFGGNDGECLPITKCVCGECFVPWEFFISICADDAYKCPSCGRGLYFSLAISVYEVVEEEAEP